MNLFHTHKNPEDSIGIMNTSRAREHLASVRASPDHGASAPRALAMQALLLHHLHGSGVPAPIPTVDLRPLRAHARAHRRHGRYTPARGRPREPAVGLSLRPLARAQRDPLRVLTRASDWVREFTTRASHAGSVVYVGGDDGGVRVVHDVSRRRRDWFYVRQMERRE